MSQDLKHKVSLFWKEHRAEKDRTSFARLNGYSFGDYHKNRDKTLLLDKCTELLKNGKSGEVSGKISEFISRLSEDRKWKKREW